MICLRPDDTGCEKYVPHNVLCLKGDNEICISFIFIIIAVFATDLWQLIFESAVLYAIEMTFKPTSIDRLKDSEKYKDEELNDQTSPDQRKDPEFNKVAHKCAGEMTAIIAYLGSIFVFVVFTILCSKYGDIKAVMIEFTFAFIIEQAKAFLVQPIIWWVFIR